MRLETQMLVTLVPIALAGVLMLIVVQRYEPVRVAATEVVHSDAPALSYVRDAQQRMRDGYCSDAVLWQRLSAAEYALAN